MVIIGLSEQTIIDQLIEGLMRKYPAVPPDTVAVVVRGIHARFNGRPIRGYVPLVVERRARSELVVRALADNARAADDSEAAISEEVEIGYLFGGTAALVMGVNAFKSS